MSLHSCRVPVMVAVTMALIVAPLHAQRTTDAETAARGMLEQRVSALDATRLLVTDYRLSVEQSAGLLTRVGFARSQVASATARTLQHEPVTAVSSLKAVGYSAVEVREALLGTGGLLNMSCIDPGGYPTVCGPSGGDVATAMGSLTVAPDGEAYTDSVLTLEGSNIPALSVLLGGSVLHQLEATTQRVRVRLPAAPMIGSLVLRRADGVEGVLRDQYTVLVAPATINWALLQEEALGGAADEVNNWIQGAEVPAGACTVGGASAVGGAGALRSTRAFNDQIRTRLLATGAPTAVADGWNRAFQGAWSAWAGGITIPGLPLYPTFAAMPEGAAPATASVPTMLGAFVSLRPAEMTAGSLAVRLIKELGAAAETTEAQLAIAGFTAILSARFISWLSVTPVTNVMGSGKVVGLSGPVTGSCQGTGVLSGIF
jgi:hypothetical protein